jgi:hypothetical protein
MILITTAGKVGSEAARQLAQRGEPVHVLVRSPDKAAALARNGIDVFQGDLEIPASLDSAMRGVTHVVHGGRRLLPLRLLQELVRWPGQCIHALEARGCHGDSVRRPNRRVPQERAELSPVVQGLRRPFANTRPTMGSGRCLRSDDSLASIYTWSARQLRVDGAAHETRPAQAQGLPRGAGRFRRDARRIATRPAAIPTPINGPGRLTRSSGSLVTRSSSANAPLSSIVGPRLSIGIIRSAKDPPPESSAGCVRR